MTVGPSGSKLAVFLLRPSVLLNIVRLKVNAIWICSQKQEELKDGRNRIQTTRERPLCCLQREEFATFSGKVQTESRWMQLFYRPRCVRYFCLFVLSLLSVSVTYMLSVSFFSPKLPVKMTYAGKYRIWKPIRVICSTFPHCMQT